MCASTLTTNRRGDVWLVNVSPAEYVMVYFDGRDWTAIQWSRPADLSKRRVIYRGEMSR